MALPVQSMTGFSRADGAGHGLRWSWELRSVNGKGLDIRFRAPPGYDHLEPRLREKVGGRMARGSIQATLTQQRETAASAIRINRQALAELVGIAKEWRPAAGGPVAIEQLLAVRGVVEIVEGDAEPAPDLIAALLATLDVAVLNLAAMRSSEGAAVGAIVAARLDRIADLATEADRSPARTPEAIRMRLEAQLAALLSAAPSLDPDRLHQEAMLLAAKADIREELDRLAAHVAAARQLLADGGAIGRRLDFLAQEFNRETNTLCAKANDRSLTAIGLELKVAVDQLREQIQNLE